MVENKMKQVAQMFGKKLNEPFAINGERYVFGEKGFGHGNEHGVACHDPSMLERLLAGRVKIMEENKLKPCPFCGREDIRAKIVNHDGYDVGIVFCITCGAQVRAFNNKEEAIEAWNRRADDGSETDLSIIGGSNNGSNNRTGIA